jgi:hypothetical protein
VPKTRQQRAMAAAERYFTPESYIRVVLFPVEEE